MTEGKSEFDRIVQEAVDKGLDFANKNCRLTIYSFLERKYHVRTDDIPIGIDNLHRALEGVFGKAGSFVIEKLIAKSLYEKLGLNFEPDDGWTIVDYVDTAKKKASR